MLISLKEKKCICSHYLLASNDSLTVKLFCTTFRISELRVVELLDGLCEKMQEYSLKVLV